MVSEPGPKHSHGDGGGGQAELSTASCSAALGEGQYLILVPTPRLILLTFVFAFLAGYTTKSLIRWSKKPPWNLISILRECFKPCKLSEGLYLLWFSLPGKNNAWWKQAFFNSSTLQGKELKHREMLWIIQHCKVFNGKPWILFGSFWFSVLFYVHWQGRKRFLHFQREMHCFVLSKTPEHNSVKTPWLYDGWVGVFYC